MARWDCRTGSGEKLSRSQAEPDQAITSAVAYFPSISCGALCNELKLLEFDGFSSWLDDPRQSGAQEDEEDQHNEVHV